MLKQQLQQKLSQKLSPQQIQLMKMIQLPLQALEQRVKQELEDNPALEEASLDFDNDTSTDFDDYEDREQNTIEAEDINVDEYLSDDEIPNYRLHANNHSADDEDARVPITAGATFTQILLDQLQMIKMDSEVGEIARYLVGAVDDDGYIRRELMAILDDLAFTRNIFTTLDKLEEALEVVQTLDPPGVGARDLQECLLLQLDRKAQSLAVTNAICILDKCFDEFSKKHYERITRKLDISEEELKDAIEEIVRLNPKPGASAAQNTRGAAQVIPDFTIKIVEGELELTLNSRNAPELNVSRSYNEMLQHFQKTKDKANKEQKEAVLFVKQKLDSAKWFIDAIKQRQHTLYITMNAIMEKQREYFLTGDERMMQPMILKDIADEIHMDISTVSRVASSKYVQTPYGTFLIKNFFSEAMTNEEGEEVSTRKIKKILEDLIGEEDKRKPITDEKLSVALKEKGFPIARRTVAKYREQLNIPVARLRKQL
ncbi:RNA polymerase factor sigma-54 [Cryomorphaceae bacterium]|nr:RNA polymerase factor sigma-54 [Cryomorphaceae bacterium]